MTTAFTRAYNDLELVLAAPYVPGAGTMAFEDLTDLPSGVPSATVPLRLSISRMRDGAKTILIFSGRTGSVLSGGTVAEGKTDIPLDAGDVAQCRVSAGYINDLEDAVIQLQQGGGGGSAPPITLQGVVLGGPSTPTITTSYPVQSPHMMLAGPATGATSAAPTFRAVAPSDLPLFTNTAAGAVPVPSPPGGSTKFLREDATWQTVAVSAVTSVGLALPANAFSVSGSPVTATGTLTGAWTSQTANGVLAAPNGSAGTPSFRALAPPDLPLFTNTTAGAVPVPSPAGGNAKFLREDATWQTVGGADPNIIMQQRTVSSTYGDYVDIGSFSGGTGEFNAAVKITLTGSGISVAKAYLMSFNYNYGNLYIWNVATPISTANTNLGDFSLDVMPGAGASFRIRSLGNGGTANIRFETLGPTVVTFTPSTATGTTTVPTSTFSSISFNGYPTPNTAYTQRLVKLASQVNPGVNFQQEGYIKIGRYDSTGGNLPHCRIVLAPVQDDQSTDFDVLTVDSNGVVGSSGHIRANGGDTTGTGPVTIAVGAGAGSGASATITGSDQDGILSVTTGSAPSSASTVVTVTFGTAFTIAPRSVVLTEANAVTASLSGTNRPYIGSFSASAWTVKSNSAALAATTTYSWYYRVGG